MTPPIGSVHFWIGGVIAPRLWQLTRSVLEKNGVETSPDLCFDMIDLERKIGAGSISCDEYCRHVLERARLPLSPERLASAIENRIELTPGLFDIVAALSREHHLYLLSDYPRQWLQPAVMRLGLARYFPDQNIVMMDTYSLVELSSDLFGRLASPRSLVPDNGLLVDGDPPRAMAALRAGIQTAIFVDAPRLKREFTLLEMLPATS